MGSERFLRLINERRADRPGFWMGNPHPTTLPMYLKHFGVPDQTALSERLGDDFAWHPADFVCWSHPEGKPIFDVLGGDARRSLGQEGVFADCDDPSAVDRFPWPDPAYMDLSKLEDRLRRSGESGMAVASGCWSCFYHVVADFFGMENYFIKMHTDLRTVLAVTERVVDFYMAANERVFGRYADRIDAFFLGNDFGSQLDLLISPECFKRFVLPYFKRLIDQAKAYGLRVMLHSCGAIDKVIPDLIDAGIDALHPLQARAKGMEAENLARYKDHLLFVGGVDTQQLLPFGTPAMVRDEVRRLRDAFGEGWIVSPSHEALLPNVSPENLLAMRDAAIE